MAPWRNSVARSIGVEYFRQLKTRCSRSNYNSVGFVAKLAGVALLAGGGALVVAGGGALLFVSCSSLSLRPSTRGGETRTDEGADLRLGQGAHPSSERAVVGGCWVFTPRR